MKSWIESKTNDRKQQKRNDAKMMTFFVWFHVMSLSMLISVFYFQHSAMQSSFCAFFGFSSIFCFFFVISVHTAMYLAYSYALGEKTYIFLHNAPQATKAK